MKNKKFELNRGFAPFLIVAIIAVLAVGGGVYVSNKNKEAKRAEIEDNLNTQANANADANANANANLGINANVNAKGTLRSLLSLGSNQQCTFTSVSGTTTSSGTVYIGADGDMSGDFQSKTGSEATVTSHMILKDGVSYVWSGNQGAKMNVSEIDASTEAQAKKYVDMDAQVDYDCKVWTRDESKFSIPSGVNFVDIAAILKLQGGVKLP